MTKIAIATTKEYFVPKDKLYLPVIAGAYKNYNEKFKKLNYQNDNYGKNISNKNDKYSEITVAFWAAKNIDADYIGLCHYRRYFKGNGERNTLNSEDLNKLLKKNDVILPKKRHYGPISVRSHYDTTFTGDHLAFCREVIQNKHPEYIKAFDKHMKDHSQHICNMFIMPKKMLNEYLDWLLDIMFEVENKIDFSQMNDFEKRVMGRLTERLLDVWIQHNNIKYLECPTIDLEGSKIIVKLFAFIKAKILCQKYKRSF